MTRLCVRESKSRKLKKSLDTNRSGILSMNESQVDEYIDKMTEQQRSDLLKFLTKAAIASLTSE